MKNFPGASHAARFSPPPNINFVPTGLKTVKFSQESFDGEDGEKERLLASEV